MGRLVDCIKRIQYWMANNRLQLNEDKTQVIWLGTRQQLDIITAQSLTLSQFTTVVSDLGILLDGQPVMFLISCVNSYQSNSLYRRIQ